MTSFENVQHRRDVLRPFGAYGVPLLLVKAVGNSGELGVTYDDEFRPLDVQHTGGGIIQVGSDAYLTLLELDRQRRHRERHRAARRAGRGGGRLLDLRAGRLRRRSGTAPSRPSISSRARSCRSCAAATWASCHGAAQADFYVTCGDDDRQLAFNFAQARAFVDDPADNSQILHVPLALGGGGTFHTGGVHFEDRERRRLPRRVALGRARSGRSAFGDGDPGRQFFARLRRSRCS